MNTAKHEFSSEEVMALLDGELSPERATVLVTHLESCADCRIAAEKLSSISKSLASWQVEAIPARISLPTIQNSAESTALPKGAFPAGRYRTLKVATGLAALVLMLSAIGIPNLLRSRMAANEASAVGSLRTINVSAAQYFNTYGHFPASLRNLGPSPSGASSENGADLIDGVLAQGLKSGYLFSYHADPSTGYRISALPLDSSKTGVRKFFTDQTGIIRAEPGGVLGGAETELAQSRWEGVAKNKAVASSRAAADSNSIAVFDKEKAIREVPTGGGKVWSENQPMIARTVSLSIVVKDFSASRISLDAILGRYHGYAANLSVNSPQESARSLQASLRIPAPQLAAAVSDLKSLGSVEGETQNGEEVTQQHADLAARLKNSAETEQRLQTILQQRTGKMSDVLDVDQEIARVRGEIEQMEAEQKNLEHRVDFATIDLKISEEYKAQLNPPTPSVSTQIHNALVNGYRNVTDTLLSLTLFFAEYGPVLLLWCAFLFVPAWWIWRRLRHATATT